VKLVDCGDVPGEARDLDGHYRRAEAAVDSSSDTILFWFFNKLLGYWSVVQKS
jgi:hypothetical protein